jgi:hypothetical protein
VAKLSTVLGHPSWNSFKWIYEYAHGGGGGDGNSVVRDGNRVE